MYKQITRTERVAFFGGGFCEALIFIAIASFLMYFYTEVMGISPMVVGTLFLVARIWDAINDPIMGALADKTKTKMGSYRPYIVFGAIPLAIFSILCFTSPALNMTGKIIWAYVTYIGMGMMYTMVALPLISMLSVSTQKPVERAGVSAARSWGANFGFLLASSTMVKLATLLGGDNEAKGYQLAMTVFALMATGILIFAGLTMKERAPVPPKQKIGVKESCALLFTNRPWIVLMVFMIVFSIQMMIRGAFGMYFFTFYIKEQQMFGPYMMANMIPTLILVPFIPLICQKIGKKTGIICGALIMLLSGVIYFAAKTDLILVFAASIVNGIGMAFIHPIMWAMLPDTVEYGEWKTGKRAPGLTVSAASFAQKAAQGLAGWLAGIILTAIAFQQGVAEQTPVTLNGLYFWNAVIPLVFGLLSVVIMVFYNLNEKTFSTIMESMEKRKANALGEE